MPAAASQPPMIGPSTPPSRPTLAHQATPAAPGVGREVVGLEPINEALGAKGFHAGNRDEAKQHGQWEADGHEYQRGGGKSERGGDDALRAALVRQAGGHEAAHDGAEVQCQREEQRVGPAIAVTLHDLGQPGIEPVGQQQAAEGHEAQQDGGHGKLPGEDGGESGLLRCGAHLQDHAFPIHS
jgi:hypothetical protein